MRYTVEFTLEVDAEDEIEAEERAYELIDMRDFCIINTNVNEL